MRMRVRTEIRRWLEKEGSPSIAELEGEIEIECDFFGDRNQKEFYFLFAGAENGWHYFRVEKEGETILEFRSLLELRFLLPPDEYYLLEFFLSYIFNCMNEAWEKRGERIGVSSVEIEKEAPEEAKAFFDFLLS